MGGRVGVGAGCGAAECRDVGRRAGAPARPTRDREHGGGNRVGLAPLGLGLISTRTFKSRSTRTLSMPRLKLQDRIKSNAFHFMQKSDWQLASGERPAHRPVRAARPVRPVSLARVRLARVFRRALPCALRSYFFFFFALPPLLTVAPVASTVASTCLIASSYS